jgi:phosphate transport system protein
VGEGARRAGEGVVFMSIHLERDLKDLKDLVLKMGLLVQAANEKAVEALTKRNATLSEEVRKGDQVIDELENDIEESCLKMLALHQPVADDLRFIVTVMKVNNDMERIGDFALNIAARAAYLSTHEPLKIPEIFFDMVKKSRAMFHDSLNALITLDDAKAMKVCAADEEIDRLNRDMFTAMQKMMYDDRETIKRAVHMLSISRYLERIADLSTNIAEDVVFMVTGQIIRHRYDVSTED